VLVESDAVLCATQQLRQRGLAVLDGFSACVSPVEFQQVERAQGHRLIALPIPQKIEHGEAIVVAGRSL